MGKTEFQKEVQSKLTLLKQIIDKMHRKHFTYASFNRKFRGILKFSKRKENSFGITLKGFFVVSINY